MKKLMALSLALLMTLSLVACGSKTEQPSTGSNSSDAEATGFVPSKNVTWICTSSAGSLTPRLTMPRPAAIRTTLLPLSRLPRTAPSW